MFIKNKVQKYRLTIYVERIAPKVILRYTFFFCFFILFEKWDNIPAGPAEVNGHTFHLYEHENRRS